MVNGFLCTYGNYLFYFSLLFQWVIQCKLCRLPSLSAKLNIIWKSVLKDKNARETEHFSFPGIIHILDITIQMQLALNIDHVQSPHRVLGL